MITRDRMGQPYKAHEMLLGDRMGVSHETYVKLTPKNKQHYKLWVTAYKAGITAGEDVNPDPMIVTGRAGGTVKKWVVDDGPCGFAQVNVPGNTSFGKFAKKYLDWSRDNYRGGNYYWIGEFGQSYTRKTAMANKINEVLNSAGLKASSTSRLD